MNADDMMGRLRTEVSVLRKEVPNTAYFLFGSAALNVTSAKDWDLLVLCSSDEDAVLVRQKLAEFCLKLPLHLFLVTRDEERELNFIATQSCQKIYTD